MTNWTIEKTTKSLSARRAWIEIFACNVNHFENTASLSARRAWIEIESSANYSTLAGSLSARRAWIEMIFISNPIFELCSRSPQGERG